MKFCLTAMALAASTTGALAQSNVEIYGRLDLSANYLKYGSTPTKASTNLSTLSSDASLIGFRGREDLGDGLRAYFKLEHGLQMDTGVQTSATAFWNRESYVGLGHSSYGSVQLGSQWSVNISASARVDPFTRFGSGSMIYLLQGGRGFQISYSNAVEYLTPTVAGVSAKVLVSAGEGSVLRRSYSGSVDYAKGPIYATLTYDQVKLTATSLGLTGNPVNSPTWNLGATYDMSVVKLHGWYQGNRIDGLPKVSGYMAGISVPIGAGVVHASYTHRSASNADASLVGVGYDYNLSKRSLMYVVLASVNNSGTAAFAIGPSGAEQRAASLPAAARDAKALQIGMRHYF
jgi:predicted porin